MLRLGPWRLSALLLSLGMSCQLHAADFTCVGNPALGKLIKNEQFGQDIIIYTLAFNWEFPSYDGCLGEVAIEGKIVPGDADKLEWLLTNRSPRVFFLRSPGGDALEAMTMGRLLRTTIARVEASTIPAWVWDKKVAGPQCGRAGEPVCCASACALVYFGGAQWKPTDRLGLHRPTLEDLGEKDYGNARKALEDADSLIRQYFQEMEIDPAVFEALMRAGPDELVIWAVEKQYTPSLQDWLRAKCKTDEDKDYCMQAKRMDLSRDQDSLEYQEAKRFSWYPNKSKDELRKMYGAVGPIRMIAVDGELERRRKIPISDQRLVRTFTGHKGYVSSIALTGDGRFALSGGLDFSVRFWDLPGGQELRSFKGHHWPVDLVAMTPDGHYGFSGSRDKTLRLWDLIAGRELRTVRVGTEVSHVALTPDGRYGLSAGSDGGLKYWDLQNGVELRTLTGHAEAIRSIAFCRDGRRGISASVDAVKVWELSTGQETHSFALNVRPKGTEDSEWHRWKKFFIQFSVSADCRYEVSGDTEGTLKVWDLSNGAEIRSFAAHKSEVSSLSLSSDGHYAISGGCASYDEEKTCEAGSLKLWDLTTGKQLHEFIGHTGYVGHVAIAPDGHFGLSGNDETLKLWDFSEWTRPQEGRR